MGRRQRRHFPLTVSQPNVRNVCLLLLPLPTSPSAKPCTPCRLHLPPSFHHQYEVPVHLRSRSNLQDLRKAASLLPPALRGSPNTPQPQKLRRGHHDHQDQKGLHHLHNHHQDQKDQKGLHHYRHQQHRPGRSTRTTGGGQLNYGRMCYVMRHQPQTTSWGTSIEQPTAAAAL